MKKTLLFLILSSQFLIHNSFAQTISGGGAHSLALCSDSTVRAWGDNFFSAWQRNKHRQQCSGAGEHSFRHNSNCGRTGLFPRLEE